MLHRSCLNVVGCGKEAMLSLHFAHFGPFWVKSQSLKRLPHSKLSACAFHLFSVTLCLMCVVCPCIDDLYILNVSGKKLAQKLQFAYFHPVSVKSQWLKRLPHSKLSACASHLFSVTLCLMCVVWPCIDDLYILNVSGQKLAPKLQFAYFHPVSFIFCYSVPNECCLDMHRGLIYFECKWPKTCAKVAVCIFAHFGQFWVKSQSVKRLPHSKLSACAC